MAIAPWLLPSVLALLLWGITTFLPKLGVRALSPLSLTVYTVFFSVISVGILLAFYGFQIGFEWKGVLLAVLIGALGRGGNLLYIFAIRHGTMTAGIVVTGLYPVFATLLAFFILGEALTARQIAGIALGIFSLILIVAAGDDRKTGA